MINDLRHVILLYTDDLAFFVGFQTAMAFI